MLRALVRYEMVSGEAVQVGDLKVTPGARRLVLRAPGPLTVGMSWVWPASVTVQRGDEAPQVLTIVDPTKLVMLSLVAAAVATSVAIMAAGCSRRGCCR